MILNNACWLLANTGSVAIFKITQIMNTKNYYLFCTIFMYVKLFFNDCYEIALFSLPLLAVSGLI